MNRTQILLEDWQCHQLQRVALSQKKSLSQLIRDWVSEKLAHLSKQNKDPLLGAASMLKGKIRGPIDHSRLDEEIYTKRG